MYISGEISDFESRMHQLVANTGDLNDFVSEGNIYYSGLDPNFQLKYEREAKMWNYRLTNDPSALTGQNFT